MAIEKQAKGTTEAYLRLTEENKRLEKKLDDLRDFADTVVAKF